MRVRGRVSLAAVMVAAIWAAGAVAEEQPAQERAAEPEVTEPAPLPVVAYRIEGLFLTRDWSASRLQLPDILDGLTGRYGPPRGMFSDLFSRERAAETKTPPFGPAELMDLVQRVVYPKSRPGAAAWADAGGPAAMEYIGLPGVGILVVTQTPAGHAAIEEFLGQMHGQTDVGGQMVTLHVRWVELDDGKVPQLLGKDPKRSVPLPVTQADLDKAKAKTVYRACTTCFDQQTVFVAAGNLKAYLGDGEPVIAEGATGIDANIFFRLIGGFVEVRPQLMSEEKTVILDFRSYVNHSGKIERKPIPDFGCVSGQETPLRVDLEYPEVDFQTLRGSVRVPLDKTVLLGLTTGPNLKAGKVLALVVEVSASE